ncbi:conserved hypothetical protein [Culex quinquefasciatus]|uniref:Sushi domain-containing protein n=1 Tax=Culex quinquefasciatus TaxID=7176 RepID=B0W3Y8_CULQU|nr:conserved hypothetical protein [Culex quinquefasciatus]|eukprot:XP_001843422.1 conserved hypothetical protein [Culex quinquefasciatus]
MAVSSPRRTPLKFVLVSCRWKLPASRNFAVPRASYRYPRKGGILSEVGAATKSRVEQQERASQKSGESAGSGLVSGRHGQAAETYAARKSARTARLDAMRSESERTERRDRIGDAGDNSSDDGGGTSPQKKRKHGRAQNIQEETDVSSELAAQLDLSCMAQGLIHAPEIDNGYVVKYNRRRKDDQVFLVAFYECDDYYELQPAETDRLFCSGKKWVGTRPTCVSTRPAGEEDEEDEEEEEEGSREWGDFPETRVEHSDIRKVESLQIPFGPNEVPWEAAAAVVEVRSVATAPILTHLRFSLQPASQCGAYHEKLESSKGERRAWSFCGR